MKKRATNMKIRATITMTIYLEEEIVRGGKDRIEAASGRACPSDRSLPRNYLHPWHPHSQQNDNQSDYLASPYPSSSPHAPLTSRSPAGIEYRRMSFGMHHVFGAGLDWKHRQRTVLCWDD
jgi:hypothetical protein